MTNMVVLVVTCLLAFVTNQASAKWSEGHFQLSSEHTGTVISKFAVPGAQHNWLSYGIRLEAEGKYPDPENVKFLLVPDTGFDEFIETRKCEDKVQYAYEVHNATLAYSPHTESSRINLYNMELDQRKFVEEMKYKYPNRSYYWYFVIMDCSLEEGNKDDQIPSIYFHIHFFNVMFKDYEQRATYVAGIKERDEKNKQLIAEGKAPNRQGLTVGYFWRKTALSADELGLEETHSFCFFVSAAVIAYLVLNILWKLKQTRTVHVAKFLLLVAAILDLQSSIYEIAHVERYKRNGKGIPVWDEMAAYMEAGCDSVIMSLLIALAFGWTLPSDVFRVQHDKSFLQSVGQGLGGVAGFTGTFFLGTGALAALHFYLARWGRYYDDEFDSYHDYEHLPGKVLMAIRMFLGFIMLGGTIYTKNCCTMISLQSFYTNLAICGTIWFQTLPLLTFFTDVMIPVHIRMHMMMTVSAIMQSVSLVVFAALLTKTVTTNILGSAYHKVSKVSQTEDTLSEGIGMSSSQSSSTAVWSLGKVKVRVD